MANLIDELRPCNRRKAQEIVDHGKLVEENVKLARQASAQAYKATRRLRRTQAAVLLLTLEEVGRLFHDNEPESP